MKTKRTVKYSLGAICAVMLLTNTTWAAPAADASEDVLDNIVITATKTEADTKDVPASVTVITADDIARANVKSVEDILRYQTGFAVKDMGGMKATKVSMRGMSQNGVLVMVDGVKTAGQIMTLFAALTVIDACPPHHKRINETIGCSTAEIAGSFEQQNGLALFCSCFCRRTAGKAAAENDDVKLILIVHGKNSFRIRKFLWYHYI